MRWISGLEEHEEREDFQAVVTPIHEIPHEYIIGARHFSSRLQQLEKILMLPMDVPTDLLDINLSGQIAKDSSEVNRTCWCNAWLRLDDKGSFLGEVKFRRLGEIVEWCECGSVLAGKYLEEISCCSYLLMWCLYALSSQKDCLSGKGLPLQFCFTCKERMKKYMQWLLSLGFWQAAHWLCNYCRETVRKTEESYKIDTVTGLLTGCTFDSSTRISLICRRLILDSRFWQCRPEGSIVNDLSPPLTEGCWAGISHSHTTTSTRLLPNTQSSWLSESTCPSRRPSPRSRPKAWASNLFGFM